jgi:hypothetical protein
LEFIVNIVAHSCSRRSRWRSGILPCLKFSVFFDGSLVLISNGAPLFKRTPAVDYVTVYDVCLRSVMSTLLTISQEFFQFNKAQPIGCVLLVLLGNSPSKHDLGLRPVKA